MQPRLRRMAYLKFGEAFEAFLPLCRGSLGSRYDDGYQTATSNRNGSETARPSHEPRFITAYLKNTVRLSREFLQSLGKNPNNVPMTCCQGLAVRFWKASTG